jgi:two-component system, response regulator PdtaR
MTGEIVLVVDDEAIIVLHLTRLLKSAGYQVPKPAYSGEMALRAIETSQKPDLILMDVGLEGPLNGIETARQIRERFSIPLIFVTAYTSEYIQDQMREVSPEGIIIKPLADKDLLDIIGKVLNRRTS